MYFTIGVFGILLQQICNNILKAHRFCETLYCHISLQIKQPTQYTRQVDLGLSAAKWLIQLFLPTIPLTNFYWWHWPRAFFNL